MRIERKIECKATFFIYPLYFSSIACNSISGFKNSSSAYTLS